MRRISLNHALEKRSQSSAICSHIHSFCFFFFFVFTAPFIWPWFLIPKLLIHSFALLLHQKTISQTFIHTFTLEIPQKAGKKKTEKKNITKHIITIFNNSPIHDSDDDDCEVRSARRQKNEKRNERNCENKRLS